MPVTWPKGKRQRTTTQLIFFVADPLHWLRSLCRLLSVIRRGLRWQTPSLGKMCLVCILTFFLARPSSHGLETLHRGQQQLSPWAVVDAHSGQLGLGSLTVCLRPQKIWLSWGFVYNLYDRPVICTCSPSRTYFINVAKKDPLKLWFWRVSSFSLGDCQDLQLFSLLFILNGHLVIRSTIHKRSWRRAVQSADKWGASPVSSVRLLHPALYRPSSLWGSAAISSSRWKFITFQDFSEPNGVYTSIPRCERARVRRSEKPRCTLGTRGLAKLTSPGWPKWLKLWARRLMSGEERMILWLRHAGTKTCRRRSSVVITRLWLTLLFCLFHARPGQ